MQAALVLSLLTLVPFHDRAGTVLEPVALRFSPSEGSSWSKSFSLESTLDWHDFTVVMNGQAVPSEYLPDIDLAVSIEQRMVVTDRYLSMGRGRPLHLRRHFAELAAHASQDFSMASPMGGDDVSESGSGEGETVLDGRTLDFRWDEDDGSYAVAWHGDDVSDPLPERIAEDMDLRALLPRDPVDVGGSWTVSGEALASLITPGGDPAFEWDGDLEDWNRAPLSVSVDGEATLTLEAVEDDAGAHVARIVITGEAVETRTLEGDLSQVPVVEGPSTQVDTATFGLSGTLHWDLGAGLLRSLDLELDGRMESVTTATDADYTHTVVMVGRSSLTVACEPRD